MILNIINHENGLRTFEQSKEINFQHLDLEKDFFRKMDGGAIEKWLKDSTGNYNENFRWYGKRPIEKCSTITIIETDNGRYIYQTQDLNMAAYLLNDSGKTISRIFG